MKHTREIHQIILSIIVMIILLKALLQNNLFTNLMIIPFFICDICILGKNVCSLLEKDDISRLFQKAFKMSFKSYMIIFLFCMIFYAIYNQEYSTLIWAAIFGVFMIAPTRKSKR